MDKRKNDSYSSNISKYIGTKWYNLTVLGESNRPDFVSCKCLCGETVDIPLRQFKTGKIKSCGCPVSIPTQERATNERLWKIAGGMIGRCRPNGDKNYGGRGIRVCDDWIESKILFVNWSKENGYKPGLSIDRIDVNGDYTPYNCRWADLITQANNKRNTVHVLGEPLQPFCRSHDISWKRVYSRMHRGGDDSYAVFGEDNEKIIPPLEPWEELTINNMTEAQISKFLLEV